MRDDANMPSDISGSALIRARRSAMAMTQSDLAERAFGTARRKGDISRIESGKVRNPQAATLRAIAMALDLDEGQLIARFAPTANDTSVRAFARELTLQSVPVSTLVTLARRVEPDVRNMDDALKVLDQAASSMADDRKPMSADAALALLETELANGVAPFETDRLLSLAVAGLRRDAERWLTEGDAARAADALLQACRLTSDNHASEAAAVRDTLETALGACVHGHNPGCEQLSLILSETAQKRSPTAAGLLELTRARIALMQGDLDNDSVALEDARNGFDALVADEGLSAELRAVALSERAALHRLAGSRNGDAERLELALQDAETALALDGETPAICYATAAAVLRSVGERQRDVSTLSRAVELAETAQTRARLLSDDLRARIVLAMCQRTLGELSGDAALLTAARAMLNGALDMADAAGTKAFCQQQIGLIAQTRGARSNDVKALKDAFEAFAQAQALRKDAPAPAHAIATLSAQGDTLQMLSQITRDPDFMAQAVDAYEAALQHLGQNTRQPVWATLQNNLATALQSLGERRRDVELLDRAEAACEAALTIRDRDSTPVDWAVTTTNLAIARATRYEITAEPRLRLNALSLLNSAIAVFHATGRTGYLEQAQRLSARLASPPQG